MNEDTKMILEEIKKLNERMNEMNDRMDQMCGHMDKLETTINKGFEDVYAAVQTCYNSTTQQINDVEERLTSKIDDLQRVTGQNCYELTLLKTKQA